MPKVITKNSKQTQDFAEKLSEEFRGGGIIALSGNLGAGKTTFAQGFAKGLGIKNKIISPTFLIIRQYPIPNQPNFFYHVDLYRIENIDLKNSGLEEILNDPTNVVLIEWAEKIDKDLPNSIQRINLKKLSEDSREIHLIS